MNLANDNIVVSQGTLKSVDFVYNGNNRGGKGIRLCVKVTAATGTTPTLDIKVQQQIMEVAGVVYLVDIPGASLAQMNGAVTTELTIYPGIAAVANRAVNSVCGGAYRVVFDFGGSYAGGEGFTLGVTAIDLP